MCKNVCGFFAFSDYVHRAFNIGKVCVLDVVTNRIDSVKMLIESATNIRHQVKSTIRDITKCTEKPFHFKICLSKVSLQHFLHLIL